MKKTTLISSMCIAAAIILFLVLFSRGGIHKMDQLKKELAQINELNNKLHIENKALRQEIKLLKNSPEYIEEIARKELGLIKSNELIYHLKKKQATSNK
jgi:cell division protein FtsL